MERFALGKVGWKPDDIVRLTIPEFMNAWEGYWEERRVERMQTFWVRKMMDSELERPEQMYWLPGDPVKKKKTEEDLKNLNEIANKKWTAQIH